ncbi:MAG: hypothetical protein L3J71_14980 [Victivallaceae bacterium]|nr:hypothetical protein [Victivallaceae bacterium]
MTKTNQIGRELFLKELEKEFSREVLEDLIGHDAYSKIKTSYNGLMDFGTVKFLIRASEGKNNPDKWRLKEREKVIAYEKDADTLFFIFMNINLMTLKVKKRLIVSYNRVISNKTYVTTTIEFKPYEQKDLFTWEPVKQRLNIGLQRQS